MNNFKESLINVKAFAFDVDGVFAGHILLTSSGEQIHPLNMKDGYAVQIAIKKGFPIAIISGSSSKLIRLRFERLGVTDIYLNAKNKVEPFDDFILKYSLKPSEVLYMGDDLPDFLVMKKAGIPTCPADAAIDIKEISKYISDLKAGEGCVRDVIEQVLRVQGKWKDSDAFNW
ncbi:MAG: 3-deoxy-D-manno-octulosonate 8-phosphate phosphatase [Bacteroidia bacterium]|nr:3-deoxy-D-manno-octulosonate 8-phosphate phosphatase [Bacteroidia bacterium]